LYRWATFDFIETEGQRPKSLTKDEARRIKGRAHFVFEL
jgi:hypothetical protein